MDVDIEVKGLRELESQLKKLGAQTASNELHKSLMFASTPTFSAYKRSVPIKSGRLKKSIKRKRLRGKNLRLSRLKGRQTVSKNTVAGVTIFTDFKQAPHAHLVEFGTTKRTTKGKGLKRPYKDANRGSMPASMAFTKAWQQKGVSGNNAINRFSTRIRKNIMKVAK